MRANGHYLHRAAFTARKEYLKEQIEAGAFLRNPNAASGGPPQMVRAADQAPANAAQGSEALPASHALHCVRVLTRQDKAQMDTMMDGLKKNMFMLIPQSIIMTWVTYFFSGFVVRTRPRPRPALALKGRPPPR